MLAGSTLLASQDQLPRIERLAPFLEGMVLLAWATATFWLPVMVAMGIWRHCVCRVPLSYHPSMWSMVFPIGMYGVATFRMIPVTGFTGLNVVPEVVLGIASVAWLLTAVRTVRSLTEQVAEPIVAPSGLSS